MPASRTCWSRFEDDDEPLGSYGAEIAAQRIAEETGRARSAGRGPGRAARGAVATYSPSAVTRWTRSLGELLALAARAEFDGDPPDDVRACSPSEAWSSA